MTKQTSHTLLLSLTALIWGLAFVAQSVGSGMGPYSFLACRSWLALVVLIPTMWVFDAVKRKKGLATGSPHTPTERKNLYLGGFFCGTALFAASAAQQIAMTINPSTAKASFITAMYVVLVPVLGVLLGRRSGGQVWLCVGISVIGLYLLCMTKGFGSVERSDLLLLLCAALFAGQILLVDRYSPLADGIRLSLVEFTVTALWATVFALLLERTTLAELQANALPLLYCGFLSSGVAYTLQIIGQKDLHPAIASIAMCLESVFGALGGWAILHQTLSGRELLGCLLIFAAVILAQLPLGQLLRKKAQDAA